MMSETRKFQTWVMDQKSASNVALSPSMAKDNSKAAQSTRADSSVLEKRHKAVLRDLLKRPNWSEAELRHIARQFGLMPWAAVAAINGWAIHQYGEPLLEGEENITVNLNLKERLKV